MRSRSPRFQLVSARAAAAALLLVLLAGCGGPDLPGQPGSATSASPSAPGSPPPSTPGAPPPPDPGSTASPPARPAPDTPEPEPEPEEPIPLPPGPRAPDTPSDEDAPVLSWLPIGPVAPSDPSYDANWYSILRDRDCERLESQVAPGTAAVWDAAVVLCKAMNTGDEAHWAEGAAILAGAAPGAGTCLEVAVHAALTRAVEHHRSYPDAAQITSAAAPGIACPVVLTGLSLGGILTDPEPCVLTSGGDDIRLTGRLIGVTLVRLGPTTTVVPTSGGENQYSFVAPPMPPGPVTVTVDGDDGPIPGEATLTYVDNLDLCPASF